MPTGKWIREVEWEIWCVELFKGEEDHCGMEILLKTDTIVGFHSIQKIFFFLRKQKEKYNGFFFPIKKYCIWPFSSLCLQNNLIGYYKSLLWQLILKHFSVVNNNIATTVKTILLVNTSEKKKKKINWLWCWHNTESLRCLPITLWVTTRITTHENVSK